MYARPADDDKNGNVLYIYVSIHRTITLFGQGSIYSKMVSAGEIDRWVVEVRTTYNYYL